MLRHIHTEKNMPIDSYNNDDEYVIVLSVSMVLSSATLNARAL